MTYGPQRHSDTEKTIGRLDDETIENVTISKAVGKQQLCSLLKVDSVSLCFCGYVRDERGL